MTDSQAAAHECWLVRCSPRASGYSRSNPSGAEILGEVRGKAIQVEKQDDIDVVYDKPPAPRSAFEVEKAIEVLQQVTIFCDQGDVLREVLSKVNTYTQRAIAKRKK